MVCLREQATRQERAPARPSPGWATASAVGARLPGASGKPEQGVLLKEEGLGLIHVAERVRRMRG